MSHILSEKREQQYRATLHKLRKSIQFDENEYTHRVQYLIGRVKAHCMATWQQRENDRRKSHLEQWLATQ